MKNLKLFRIIMLIFMIIPFVNALGSSSYDITGADYLTSKSVGTFPRGVAVNNDSTRFYIVEAGTDTIKEYVCTLPNNVSTCSLNYSKTISTEDGGAEGITWNDDGSRLFMIGINNDRVYEYHCSNNYILSTCSYDSSFLVSAQDTNPTGVFWNKNGTRMYIVGSSSNAAWMYTCSAYDVSTCGFTNGLSLLSKHSTVQGGTWNDIGTELFVVGDTSDLVTSWSCPTPYTLTGCTYNTQFNLNSFDTSPRDIIFNNNGEYMYIAGFTGNSILQFGIYDNIPPITIDYEPYYNYTNITISFNTTKNLNISYVLNGGIETSVCTNCNSSSFNLNSLPETENQVIFIANYDRYEENTTLSITIDLTNPVINNNIEPEYNSYTINGFNSSCSDINLDYCNISLNGQNVALNVTTFTFTSNGNISYNITGKDLAGNLVTESGTILVNPTLYFKFNSTTLLTSFTFGGRSSVDDYVAYTVYNDGLVLGNNSLEFSKTGYATTTVTFNVNTTMPTNITFQVSPAQLNINIYDKITGSLVTGIDFDLTLVGETGYNTTTNTGTKTINGILLGVGDYRLIVTSDNYFTENEFFTFNNDDELNLSIYVTSNVENQSGYVILEVLDSDGAPIENVIVQAKQWFGSLSTYISVSEDKTGSDGKGQVNVILDDKIYVFSATLNGLTTQSVEYIITTPNNGRTITLTLVLDTAYMPNFKFENLITNATEVFNNVTNTSTVTFIWENNLGTDITGCINAYRIQNYKQILLQTDCTTSDSATKIKSYVLTLKDYDYIIKAEILFDGKYYVVEEFKHYKTGSIFNILKNYGLHYILYLAMVIVSVWAGIKIDSVPIGSILLILSALMLVSIDPILFTASVGGLLTFIGVLILWGSSR